MSKLKRITYATTLQLLEINKWSVDNGMNRSMSEEAEKLLDPDGIHMVSFMLEHNHRMGEKIEPHWRVQWMLKFKDKSSNENPPKVFIDICKEKFSELTTTRDVDFDNSSDNVNILSI